MKKSPITHMSTIPMNVVNSVKKYFTQNILPIHLMLREAIRNAIGHSAKNIFISAYLDSVDEKNLEMPKYALILHDAEEGFQNKMEIMNSLKTNSSSKVNGGVMGLGGTLSCILGNVSDDKKETVFFGNTVEEGFKAISLRIDSLNDITTLTDVTDIWEERIKMILDKNDRITHSKISHINSNTLKVGYAYRIGDDQNINGRMLPSMLSIIDIPEHVNIRYSNVTLKKNITIDDKNDFLLDHKTLENYSFICGEPFDIGTYTHHYKNSRQKDTKCTFNVSVSIRMYPQLMAKHKNTGNSFPVNKNKGVHTTVNYGKNLPNYKTKLYMGNKVHPNSNRASIDPIYLSTNTSSHFLDDMGLSIISPSIHNKLEYTNEIDEIFKEFYFNDDVIDIHNDYEIKYFAPIVCPEFYFNFKDRNLTRLEQKGIINDLMDGFNFFFLANKEEEVRKMCSNASELIYTRLKNTENYSKIKSLFKSLIPIDDEIKLRKPSVNIIEKNIGGGNNVRYKLMPTEVGMLEIENYVKNNPDAYLWKVNEKSNGGRPQSVNDTLYGIPPNVSIESRLYDRVLNEFTKNAKIENNSNDDITVVQGTDDEKYRVTVKRFYEIDGDVVRNIKASEYDIRNKNHHPKQATRWTINGNEANVSWKVLLPVSKKIKNSKTETKEPNVNGDLTSEIDDFYGSFPEELKVYISNKRILINKENRTMMKICRDSDNYPPKAKVHFDEFVGDMLHKANELMSTQNIVEAFTNKPYGTSKDIDEIIDKYGNVRNYAMNTIVDMMIEYHPAAKRLLKYYDELQEINDYVDIDSLIEND